MCVKKFSRKNCMTCPPQTEHVSILRRPLSMYAVYIVYFFLKECCQGNCGQLWNTNYLTPARLWRELARIKKCLCVANIFLCVSSHVSTSMRSRLLRSRNISACSGGRTADLRACAPRHADRLRRRRSRTSILLPPCCILRIS